MPVAQQEQEQEQEEGSLRRCWPHPLCIHCAPVHIHACASDKQNRPKITRTRPPHISLTDQLVSCMRVCRIQMASKRVIKSEKAPPTSKAEKQVRPKPSKAMTVAVTRAWPGLTLAKMLVLVGSRAADAHHHALYQAKPNGCEQCAAAHPK